MADKVRQLVAWQLVLLDGKNPDDFGLSLDQLPLTPLIADTWDFTNEDAPEREISSPALVKSLSRSLPDLSRIGSNGLLVFGSPSAHTQPTSPTLSLHSYSSSSSVDGCG